MTIKKEIRNLVTDLVVKGIDSRYQVIETFIYDVKKEQQLMKETQTDMRVEMQEIKDIGLQTKKISEDTLEQAKETNGRVTEHDHDITVLQEGLKNIRTIMNPFRYASWLVVGFMLLSIFSFLTDTPINELISVIRDLL